MDSYNGFATLLQPSGFDSDEISSQANKAKHRADDVYRSSKDIARLREDLIIARVELREKRACIADYRAKTTEALANAVDHMRSNISSSVPSVPKILLSNTLHFVQKCHELHNSAVNDYEEAETEYNQQEKDLNAKELQVNSAEIGLEELREIESHPRRSNYGKHVTPPAYREQHWPVFQDDEEDKRDAALRSHCYWQMDKLAAQKEKLHDLRCDKQAAIVRMDHAAQYGLDSTPEMDFLNNLQTWEKEQSAELEDSCTTLRRLQHLLEARKLEMQRQLLLHSSETRRVLERGNMASSKIVEKKLNVGKAMGLDKSEPLFGCSEFLGRSNLRRRSMSDGAIHKVVAYHSRVATPAPIRQKNTWPLTHPHQRVDLQT